MLNSKEFQPKLPFYSTNCEVSLGKFLPYINPEEALAITSSCSGKNINFVDCKSSHKKHFIEEIDGFGFDSVKTKTRHDFQLPRYIPIVCASFFECNPESVSGDIIGVSLKDIISYFLREKSEVLKMPIFKDKKVILFMSGNDKLIEGIWQQSNHSNVFEKIGNTGFFAIMSVNFSVFFGECPVGHAINLKKSLKTLELIEQVGGRMIPHLYWANKYHLERWVEWLNNNLRVRYITINCQMYKKHDYQLIREGIVYIKANAKNNLKFILEGPKKLECLINDQLVENSIVAYKGPSYNTRNYRQYFSSTSGKLKVLPAEITDMSKLLLQNIKMHSNYIQKIFQN